MISYKVLEEIYKTMYCSCLSYNWLLVQEEIIYIPTKIE